MRKRRDILEKFELERQTTLRLVYGMERSWNDISGVICTDKRRIGVFRTLGYCKDRRQDH
jgi:hypothetical protein